MEKSTLYLKACGFHTKGLKQVFINFFSSPKQREQGFWLSLDNVKCMEPDVLEVDIQAEIKPKDEQTPLYCFGNKTSNKNDFCELSRIFGITLEAYSYSPGEGICQHIACENGKLSCYDRLPYKLPYKLPYVAICSSYEEFLEKTGIWVPKKTWQNSKAKKQPIFPIEEAFFYIKEAKS